MTDADKRAAGHVTDAEMRQRAIQLVADLVALGCVAWVDATFETGRVVKARHHPNAPEEHVVVRGDRFFVGLPGALEEDCTVCATATEVANELCERWMPF